MPATELLPGQTFSFVQIETYLPVPIAGIKRLSYKDNLTRKGVWGTQSVQIGLTRGKYEASGEIEVYLRTAALAFFSQAALRTTPNTMTVMYGPNGDGLTISDVIPQYLIGDIDADQSEGDEALTRKFSLIIPQQILWNGKPTFIETFGAIAIA
jgi:hypothetical protein